MSGTGYLAVSEFVQQDGEVQSYRVQARKLRRIVRSWTGPQAHSKCWYLLRGDFFQTLQAWFGQPVDRYSLGARMARMSLITQEWLSLESGFLLPLTRFQRIL